MIIRASFWLSYQDSNLDKQNQKLLCYHYTIGQCDCKDTHFCKNSQTNWLFFYLYVARRTLRLAT